MEQAGTLIDAEDAVAERAATDLRQLDLGEFVKEPGWREVLLEAIESQQLDPWNIDIAKVADAYLLKVRSLVALDLHVPANVILASALLLQYKASALRLEEPEPEVLDQVRALYEEDIPPLAFNPDLARSRPVTLAELLDAVEEVMKSPRREVPRREKPAALEFDLSKESMHELMQKVYDRAHEIKDGESMLLFSRLAKSFNGHGEPHSQVVSHSLIPVLHLVQEQRMMAWQDALYGEIFIKVY
ncbi:MAG: segregation/condensation protein A [Candidatus Micrarchaeota archaeon]